MDRKDISSGILWICISAAVIIASVRIGLGPADNPGAGFLPFWAGVLMFFFSCALTLAGRKKKEAYPQLAELWKGWQTPALVVASLILYCILIPMLGYVATTFGLMSVLFAMWRIRLWLTFSGAALAAVLSFFLFDFLLKVPLPRGILGF